MCNHAAWLQSFTKPALCFSSSSRLEAINRSLADPSQQYPAVIFGLGRRRRDLAFKVIFPHNNNERRGKQASFANLYVDNSTLHARYPLLFAESDILSPFCGQQSFSTCHPNETHFPTWSSSPPAFATKLLSKVILPFCDVVCIFSEDFGTLSDVLTLLNSWVLEGDASSLPTEIRPQVLVISVDSTTALEGTEHLQITDLAPSLLKVSPLETSGSFFSVEHVAMVDRGLSPQARFQSLRDIILRRVDHARIRRRRYHSLFSATHLASLFASRLPHFAHSALEVFDVVKASREKIPLHPEHGVFIEAFTQLCVSAKIPYPDIAAVLASSFLMQAYPPGMHMFNPAEVFGKLFEPSCLAAMQKLYGTSPFVKIFVSMLREQFAHLRMQLKSGEGAAAVHRRTVLSRPLGWATVRSNRCCVFCVAAKPEHVLTCGHALCDDCVRVFGAPRPGLDHCFVVADCMFCHRCANLTVHLKPPTAGTRILSVDGGGVRGIVPLEFLRLLQCKVGADFPIQDLFDLAIGTSAGGLITLGLFIKRWDVPKCIRLFRAVTSRVFGAGNKGSLTALKRVGYYIRALLVDGGYDSAVVNEALQEHFGTSCTIFDSPALLKSGSKVAVTATTISKNAGTFLFSNYNGYKHYRSADPLCELKIWEAARATSAAPLLFKSADLPFGTFQDGGLLRNNPVDLALKEQRKIWPEGTRRDVVLSLGTGSQFSDLTQSPLAPSFRSVRLDGFVQRVLRSFMSSLDGDVAWRELSDRLDQDVREDYFRFNIRFKGKEPEIDDVGCMDALASVVHEQIADERLHDLAVALLVSCFYFELDENLQFEDGVYRCRGTIRCRLECKKVIRALRALVKTPLKILIAKNSAEAFNPEEQICPSCERFSQRLSFFVRHPAEIITIHVELDSKSWRKLSGFPQSMDWFEARRDHLTTLAGRCGRCGPSRKRKYVPEAPAAYKQSRLRLL